MHTPAFSPRADAHATRQAIREGRSSAAAEMAQSIALAQASASAHVWRRLEETAAFAQAAAAPVTSALAGLAIGIKDLFDVQGQVSASGSALLQGSPAASADSPAVARLRAAGGAVMGRTAQNEWAFSGMGVNPHFGTPANPLDAHTPRLPGGSSSGAAVAVASGAAFIALGSDTGGSVRIPAALCGVVGFKPSTGIIPTSGAVPLSTTLDTVGPLARSVRDCALAFELLSWQRVGLTPRLNGLRVGVPSTLMLDALDPEVAQSFDRALACLRQAGAHIAEIKMPQLAQTAALQAKAGFSSIEGLAWHRRHGHWDAASQLQIDPRVRQRMAPAETALAVDYADLLHARQAWCADMRRAVAPFDVLASPTVPITARPIASVLHDDAAFFSTNALMLRNTAPINFFGAPAISVPMQRPGEMGAGLMLWASPGADATVLNAAAAAEAALQKL